MDKRLRRKITKGTGDKMRPTSGKVLAALFSILCSASLEEADFLDLFAGTGEAAMEALKRGAKQVVCVESDAFRAKKISARLSEYISTSARQNDRGAGAECIRGDARRAIPSLARENREFGVVFADPPYGMGWGQTLPKLMEENWSLVSSGGAFVFERSSREEPAEISIPRDDRVYGETILSFYWKQLLEERSGSH